MSGESRFPELMASVQAEKSEGLDARLMALKTAVANLPEHWSQYQWRANPKPIFGERYVYVHGENGRGMGRQAVACVPGHLGPVATFIAAANPDTVSMLVAEIERLRAKEPSDV